MIRDNNAKVNNIRNTIADISAKIKALQDNVDKIKRDSNALEVDLDRARTDLSVAQVKDNKLSDDIKGFKDRIIVEQAKVVEDDLAKLRVIVDKLSKSYPTIQAGIDR
jgi:chromosome segregation ATPase